MRRDTTYLPLPIENGYLDDDAEDIDREVRDRILSKSLGEEFDEEDEDNQPSPVTPE